MKSLFIALLLFSSSSFAAEKIYNIQVDWSLAGKKQQTGTILVAEGKTALMEEKNKDGSRYIEVTAKPGMMGNRTGILLDFVVGTIDKSGKKEAVIKPQILATESVPATATLVEKAGREVELNVMVKTN